VRAFTSSERQTRVFYENSMCMCSNGGIHPYEERVPAIDYYRFDEFLRAFIFITPHFRLFAIVSLITLITPLLFH
jgi:hypothetical protein